MKRPVLALICCLLLATVCAAQQPAGDDAPASKEDIQRYLDTVHLTDLMKNMMAQMGAQMKQIMHDQLAKQPNLAPGAQEFADKSMDDVVKNFPIDEYLAAVIPVYQKYLTKGDVNALVTFYSSPVGQKILAETPSMTADAMKASSGIMQKLMADQMQRIQDHIAQMAKENDGSSNTHSETKQN